MAHRKSTPKKDAPKAPEPVYITDDEDAKLNALNLRVAKARAEAARAAAIARSLEEERNLYLMELAEKHGWTDLLGDKVVIQDKRFVPSAEALQLLRAAQQRRG